MPFELIWEPSGVYRRYFGDVTIAERRASFDGICGDYRFDDLCYTITDYLGVGNYEINAEATVEIAAMHIAPLITNPNIRIAAVVTRPDIIAAINDLKSYAFTKAPYRVFASIEEARQWVRSGLP